VHEIRIAYAQAWRHIPLLIALVSSPPDGFNARATATTCSLTPPPLPR
jgi:hypothetical protein